MGRFATLKLFHRIVERGSFSAAAADCGVSRPVATGAIKALEERVGARLLQRSTRHVQPTVEGLAYYQRTASILAQLEDADQSVGGAIAGVVRVDVPGNLARTMILPKLHELMARHPSLTVFLGEGERFVNLVREGVDCVIRAGDLADSDMIARRLGVLDEITVASPGYLAAHGVPVSPDALVGHDMVGFVSSRTGQAMPLEFTQDGEAVERMLPIRLLVAGADTSAEAARLGFGLVQAPRYRFAQDLASGALVEVLSDYSPSPTPVSVLYPSNRQLSPRVRVFIDWLVATVSPQLDGAQ